MYSYYLTWSNSSKQHENDLIHVSKGDKCDFCLRAARDRTVSRNTIQRLTFLQTVYFVA